MADAAQQDNWREQKRRQRAKVKVPAAKARVLAPAFAISAYVRSLEGGQADDLYATRTTEWCQAQVERLKARIPDTNSPLQRAQLVQQRRNLEYTIEQRAKAEQSSLKVEFVKHAAAWGAAHGIEYETWRELGVPAAVLREAGIER